MNPNYNQLFRILPPYMVDFVMNNRPDLIRQLIPQQVHHPIHLPQQFQVPIPQVRPPMFDVYGGGNGGVANPIFVDSDSDEDVQLLPFHPAFEPPPPPPPPLPTREISLDTFTVVLPSFSDDFTKALNEALRISPEIDLGRCSNFLEKAVRMNNQIDNLVDRIILAGNDAITPSAPSFRADLEKVVSNFFPKTYLQDIKRTISMNRNNLVQALSDIGTKASSLRQMKNPRSQSTHIRITDIVVSMQVIQYSLFLRENHEKADKQKRYDEARRCRLLIECECCCCDYLEEDLSHCPKGHSFCKVCLNKEVETLIGEGRSEVVCLSHSAGCTENVSVPELAKSVNGKTLKRLFVMESQNAVAQANLPGIVKCHKCGFEAMIDNSGTFHCPECKADTCPGCGEPSHVGLSCESMKNIDKNRIVEEKMNEAVIRVCPKCKAQFMKEEGCNKMECPRCHTWICYWCRKEIPKEIGYNHFWRQQGLCPPDKCPLWVQNDTLHQIEAERAKEDGQQDLL